MALTFDSTDLDNAASEIGVVHQNTANTDHNNANVLKQGYDYANFGEITPDPSHCYPLHEDSGTTANDLAGSSNGTYNGPTLGQAGILGTTAPSFDGVDDYIDCNTAVIPDDTTQPFTFSCWFFRNDATNRGSLMGRKDSDGANSFAGYVLEWQGGGDIVVSVYDGNDNIQGRYNNNTSGSWTHLSMVYDGSQDINGLHLYINGSVVSFDSTRNENIDNSTGVTEDFTIGARDSENPDLYVDGRMSDCRVYTSALSGSEIQTLYNVVGTKGELITSAKTT